MKLLKENIRISELDGLPLPRQIHLKCKEVLTPLGMSIGLDASLNLANWCTQKKLYALHKSGV